MFDLITKSPLLAQTPLELTINLIVVMAFALIVTSVVVDFIKYHKQNRNIKDGAKSFVETGSMTAFFVIYYLSIKSNFLFFKVDKETYFASLLVGLILILIGILFNVYGRLVLKSNWANQIKIYNGHTLVTNGPYRVVRHPLYASLIWIFLGGSLVYMNLASLLLNLLVFVPMMTIRAKKEEELLSKNFGLEYNKYRSKTGMFFPKVGAK